MAKKCYLQQALKLIESDDFYSSCNYKSNFDETQTIKSFSSENSEDDDGIDKQFEIAHKEEKLSIA